MAGLVLSQSFKESLFHSSGLCCLPVTLRIAWFMHISLQSLHSFYHITPMCLCVPEFHIGVLWRFKVNLDPLWTHFNLNTSAKTHSIWSFANKLLFTETRDQEFNIFWLIMYFNSQLFYSQLLNDYFPMWNYTIYFQWFISHIIAFWTSNYIQPTY